MYRLFFLKLNHNFYKALNLTETELVKIYFAQPKLEAGGNHLNDSSSSADPFSKLATLNANVVVWTFVWTHFA